MPEPADRAAVRDWMQKKGLTQAAAAEALGCAQSYLSHYLSGDKELGPSSMATWSRITGISRDVFALARVRRAS